MVTSGILLLCSAILCHSTLGYEHSNVEKNGITHLEAIQEENDILNAGVLVKRAIGDSNEIGGSNDNDPNNRGMVTTEESNIVEYGSPGTETDDNISMKSMVTDTSDTVDNTATNNTETLTDSTSLNTSSNTESAYNSTDSIDSGTMNNDNVTNAIDADIPTSTTKSAIIQSHNDTLSENTGVDDQITGIMVVNQTQNSTLAVDNVMTVESLNEGENTITLNETQPQTTLPTVFNSSNNNDTVNDHTTTPGASEYDTIVPEIVNSSQPSADTSNPQNASVTKTTESADNVTTPSNEIPEISNADNVSEVNNIASDNNSTFTTVGPKTNGTIDNSTSESAQTNVNITVSNTTDNDVPVNTSVGPVTKTTSVQAVTTNLPDVTENTDNVSTNISGLNTTSTTPGIVKPTTTFKETDIVTTTERILVVTVPTSSKTTTISSTTSQINPVLVTTVMTNNQTISNSSEILTNTTTEINSMVKPSIQPGNNVTNSTTDDITTQDPNVEPEVALPVSSSKPELTSPEPSSEPEVASIEPSVEPNVTSPEPNSEPDIVSPESSSKPETVSPEPSPKPEVVSTEPNSKPELSSPEPSSKPELTSPEAEIVSTEPSSKPEVVSPEPSPKPELSSPEPSVEPELTSPEPSSEPELTSPEPSSEPELTSPEPSSEPGDNESDSEPEDKVDPETAPEGETEPDGETEPGSEGEPEGEEEPNPESELDAFAEPGPDWDLAKEVWQEAWEFHIYFFGIAFAVLGLYCFITLIRLWDMEHLISKHYFVTLNILVILVCILRSTYLLLDAYNSSGTFPVGVDYFMYSTAFPCLTALFSILFYSLLLATRVRVMSSKVQKLWVLLVIVILHFVLSIVTDVVVGFFSSASVLILVCQVFFIVWGLLMFIGYLFLFRKLYKGAILHQKTLAGLQYEHKSPVLHGHGYQSKPKHKYTFGLAVKFTFVSAFFGVAMVGFELYGIFGVYGVLRASSKPEPWPWWTYHVIVRTLELLMCLCCTFVASQPLRYKVRKNSNHRMYRYCLPCNMCCYPSSLENNETFSSSGSMDCIVSEPDHLSWLKKMKNKKTPSPQAPYPPHTAEKYSDPDATLLVRKIKRSKPSMLVVEDGFVRIRRDDEILPSNQFELDTYSQSSHSSANNMTGLENANTGVLNNLVNSNYTGHSAPNNVHTNVPGINFDNYILQGNVANTSVPSDNGNTNDDDDDTDIDIVVTESEHESDGQEVTEGGAGNSRESSNKSADIFRPLSMIDFAASMESELDRAFHSSCVEEIDLISHNSLPASLEGCSSDSNAYNEPMYNHFFDNEGMSATTYQDCNNYSSDSADDNSKSSATRLLHSPVRRCKSDDTSSLAPPKSKHYEKNKYFSLSRVDTIAQEDIKYTEL